MGLAELKLKWGLLPMAVVCEETFQHTNTFGETW